MKVKVGHTSSTILNSCSFRRYRLWFRNLYSILLTQALCPTLRYIGSLDIRMSSLDKHMSNLTMLFDLIIFNYLSNGSIKNLDTHMSRLDIRMSVPTMLVLSTKSTSMQFPNPRDLSHLKQKIQWQLQTSSSIHPCVPLTPILSWCNS